MYSFICPKIEYVSTLTDIYNPKLLQLYFRTMILYKYIIHILQLYQTTT